jgi:UDP-2,3-diacylglucosamine hydrolase
MAGLPVYIMSDAHLGTDSRAREAAREARLHRFLTSLPGRASHLVIDGDLFDFWFEYGTAIPRRHFDTLAVLHQLRRSGLAITYLTGNHDFYLGPFLRDDLGITTHAGGLPLEIQGRRLWIHHGDGLVGGDLGYRVLKGLLRHPASIAAYRWLHPDLGIPLAHWASRWSRHARGERTLDGDRLWREVAVPRFAEGHEIVVIGHFHHAYERHEGGRSLFVLGDWIDQFTYLVLEDGQPRLETWPER